MRVTCPRCKSDEARMHYDLGEASIVACVGCGLLYLHPWPTPEETSSLYGEDYFHNVASLKGDPRAIYGYADYIAERANKQSQYARIARELRALLLPREGPPRLLEVGCGYGYFLDEAFEQGFEVTGLEFNRFAVERLRRKYAFPILAGALEDVELPPAHFDAVVMFDVIEHLRDPFRALDSLCPALRPGGVLVVSTPDAESVTSRLLGARLEDFRRTREHLFFFGRRTLGEMLREHGFDPITMRSIGHTFELAFLLSRLALYNRALFTTLRRVVVRLGLGGLKLEVNPRTKMIAFARRRGRSGPARLAAAFDHADPPSELDRHLVAELDKLETSTGRHYAWVADRITPWLGRNVLEVGSGIGVISKFLIPRCETLTLTDYHPTYLRLLEERFGDVPNLRYQILDLNQRPYRIEQADIDTIVCLNVVEHLDRDDEILAALADVLPRGGRLVLQVPRHPALFGTLDQAYGHLRRYTAATLRRRLQEAGFRIVSLRGFNALSTPGWWLSGKLLRRRDIDPRMLRMHDALVPVARAVDRVLPFAGVSLLACAEKR
jgi:SAM-dependent methyltransferase